MGTGTPHYMGRAAGTDDRILGMPQPVFYTLGAVALVAAAIAIGVVISRQRSTNT